MLHCIFKLTCSNNLKQTISIHVKCYMQAKSGHSIQSDRAARAGNQWLICLRSLLINMDNCDPKTGWGFLSNWITVSLPASKYCLELIPLNYLNFLCAKSFPPISIVLVYRKTVLLCWPHESLLDPYWLLSQFLPENNM